LKETQKRLGFLDVNEPVDVPEDIDGDSILTSIIATILLPLIQIVRRDGFYTSSIGVM
jgi:hypothetical protein